MVFLSKDNNFITTAFIRSLTRSFARRTFKCSLHDLQRLFANFFLILSSAEWFFLFASGNSLSCNRWIHVCVCKYGGVMARYAYVCLCIPQVGSFFSLSFYQIRKLAYTASNWCFPCSITPLNLVGTDDDAIADKWLVPNVVASAHFEWRLCLLLLQTPNRFNHFIIIFSLVRMSGLCKHQPILLFLHHLDLWLFIEVIMFTVFIGCSLVHWLVYNIWRNENSRICFVESF